ncbi:MULTISPECIES: IclR family transcriptional regulator [unclassified Microbacterium]|uniref:IclR family transcriptional regulator n=1 Tax=unclassified Microbacterium TaxID=2609290 RepID=UPI0030105F48
MTAGVAERMPSVRGMRSAERAFEILERLADAGGELAISEIADVSGLPLATAHRLLRALVDAGCVRQVAHRRYALGARLAVLGDAANGSLARRARSVLRALVSELEESASLAVLDGDRMIHLLQVSSPHPMRMDAEVGRRHDLRGSAAGLVILAHLDREQCARILQREALRHEARGCGVPELGVREHEARGASAAPRGELGLLLEIAAIRRHGVAVRGGGSEVGARCIAVPVPRRRIGEPAGGVSADSDLLAAVCVAGPSSRVGESFVARAVPLMRAAAREIADSALP